MDKFTTVQKRPEEKQENDILFNGKYIDVLSYQDHEFISENDTIAILPYFKDEGFILMRHEYNLAYQYKLKDFENYRNTTNFLSCITGTVEANESIIQAVRREFYEEAGIVLSEFYPLEIEKKFFKTKNSVSTYYPFLLEINNNEYKSTSIVGDGTKDEEFSRTIKIDVQDLDQIQTFDMITEYLLLRLKNEYNF